MRIDRKYSSPLGDFFEILHQYTGILKSSKVKKDLVTIDNMGVSTILFAQTKDGVRTEQSMIRLAN